MSSPGLQIPVLIIIIIINFIYIALLIQHVQPTVLNNIKQNKTKKDNNNNKNNNNHNSNNEGRKENDPSSLRLILG